MMRLARRDESERKEARVAQVPAGLRRWALSKRATGGTPDRCPVDNLRDVHRNWDALRTAHELAFGRLRPDDPHPQARAGVRALLEFVWQIVVRGTPAVADWCHARRAAAFRPAGSKPPAGATRGAGRGVERVALHAAAGLDRAWVADAPQSELDTAMAAAAARLTAPKVEISAGEKRHLLAFVRDTARRADGHHGRVAPLVAANAHACGQHGRRVGGQRAAVDAWGTNDGLRAFRLAHVAAGLMLRRQERRDAFAFDATLESTYAWTQQQGAWLDAMDWCGRGTAREDLYPPDLDEIMDEADRRNADRAVKLRAWAAAVPGGPRWPTGGGCSGGGSARPPAGSEWAGRWPDATDVVLLAASPLAQSHEACLRVAAEVAAGTPTVCKLSMFANVNGKPRCATVHPAHVVVAARAMSKWLLSRLRHVRTNSAMLRNEIIRLQAQGDNWSIHSADLSKATDHISNLTAEDVVSVALDATNAPRWMRDAVPGVVGNMVLDEIDGPPVTCGGLMGLGPSWVILSLLNDFAATRAGAKPSSFAVNGDDLVGAWGDDLAARYQDALRRVRLVPNVAKSFDGAAGTFCEQFVAPSGPKTAISRSLHRLGECSGAKSIEGARGHCVVDTLRDIAAGRRREGWMSTPAPVRALAGRTAKRVRLNAHPGRIADGGGGSGRADATTAADFVLHGASSTRVVRSTPTADASSRARLRRVLALPSDGTGRRLRDVAADMAAVDNARDDVRERDWAERARAPDITLAAHRRRANCRRAAAAATGPFDALRTDAARARWGAAARATAHRHFEAGRFESGIRYLASHTRRVAEEPTVPLFPPHLRLASGASSHHGGRVPTT